MFLLTAHQHLVFSTYHLKLLDLSKLTPSLASSTRMAHLSNHEIFGFVDLRPSRVEQMSLTHSTAHSEMYCFLIWAHNNMSQGFFVLGCQHCRK